MAKDEKEPQRKTSYFVEVIGFDSVRGFHYKVKFGVPGEATPIGTEKAFHHSFLQYPYEPLYGGRRVR